MHSVSKHARHGVVSYLLYSFTFSLLLVDKCLPDVAGAITALPLTFRKQKQIAITESLGVGKQALHRAVSLHQHGSGLF